jgi:hypothetical protein
VAANIEYIWNVGQYEHIKWSGTVEDWDAETAESLAKLGQQWIAGRSQVLFGRDNPEPMPEEAVQELIQKELRGKVVEVTKPETPAASEKKPKPWDVPIETKAPEWEPPTPVVTTIISGLEDF